MNWKKFKEEKPSEGEEVLAYHPSWIDEDFNPRRPIHSMKKQRCLSEKSSTCLYQFLYLTN